MKLLIIYRWVVIQKKSGKWFEFCSQKYKRILYVATWLGLKLFILKGTSWKPKMILIMVKVLSSTDFCSLVSILLQSLFNPGYLEWTGGGSRRVWIWIREKNRSSVLFYHFDTKRCVLRQWRIGVSETLILLFSAWVKENSALCVIKSFHLQPSKKKWMHVRRLGFFFFFNK